MEAPAPIRFASTGPVAQITLCRPEKLNALTPEMLEELCAIVRRVQTDTSIRALVLHGEGRCFSVGADIHIWSALDAEAFRTRWILGGHEAFNAVANCRVPVIAALHGMVFGGGLELALAADLRVAERAATLALPEVSLGTVPGWGGTQRLPDLVGKSRAKQMVLSAERVSADTAAQWGLVNDLCEPGQALETALRRARGIAELAPISVQLAKRIIDGSGHAADAGAGATLEMLAGMVTQSTADMREGIAALRSKRSPSFAGR